MIIQVILIGALVLLFAVFVGSAHTVRGQAAKRVGFILFVLGNAYGILRPNDVTWVAKHVGVGRGADLVLYLLVIAFAFFAVNTYLRFRALERRFTDLARTMAVQGALEPPIDTLLATVPESRDGGDTTTNSASNSVSAI
jgi:small membrane protein